MEIEIESIINLDWLHQRMALLEQMSLLRWRAVLVSCVLVGSFQSEVVIRMAMAIAMGRVHSNP